LHVRVDERTAGFLALGLSIGSRRPVAVVTTSGTAVGNLLPSVMEAHHSGRQVVVVSADRPASLRGTGANQTTEQAGIFGTFAVCHDLGVACDDSLLEAAVRRACERSGPTHLNVQLAAPLLPADEPWWPGVTRIAVAGPEPLPAGPEPLPAGPETPVAGPEPLPAEPEVLPRGARTVVVAGDGSGPGARLLAERAGWPLLAEPTSGSRVGANAVRTYRLLLGTGLGEQVERVVVMGHPTLSRPVTALVSRPDVEVLAVPGPGGVVTDPARVARHLDAAPSVAPGDPPAADRDRLGAWRRADAELGARLDALVDALPELDPLQAAREVAAAVTARATLVAGSSSPVRDLDLMMRPYPPHEHRFVVGNRGLSGIDGTVSTALGVALGRRGASHSLALMGDLTLLHDANGLILGPDEPRPDLTIVVVNDDGGSIFATLEQGAAPYAAGFERVFGTPHRVDLAALCAASHTPYTLVSSAAQLGRELGRRPRGVRVVEARVSRADRRGTAAAVSELVRGLT
ncbi:MAG: 2-succinyl-5-enolpyruvyl-6-hydroxy-3-cyclohexene-1-carboxylic-acid synthase, partial [Lapillicoccus sp.]